MIDVAPFEAADLGEIEVQAQQAAEMASVGGWQALAEVLAKAGPAWTLRRDGRILGCGGVGVLWAGRAEAWCFLAAGIPRTTWPALHRIAARTLDRVQDELALRRIEASCAYGWPPGRRWLEMLGFGEAHLARGYAPDGRDFWKMARVRA